MDDKKLLKDDELEKVVGGVGASPDVKEAFIDAKNTFKSIGDVARAYAEHGADTANDAACFDNMVSVCEMVIGGSLDAETAILKLQCSFDALTKYQDEAAGTMNALKAVVGK